MFIKILFLACSYGTLMVASQPEGNFSSENTESTGQLPNAHDQFNITSALKESLRNAFTQKKDTQWRKENLPKLLKSAQRTSKISVNSAKKEAPDRKSKL